MTYEIEYYRKRDRGEWDRFIRTASQGTFFHFQRFFDYHPSGRFRHRHLVFRSKGHIVAVWPGAIREEDGLRAWTSHPGSSYGGLITRPDLSLLDIHRLVHDLVVTAQREKVERLRCTPPPLIYHRNAGDMVEFAMLRAGFTYLKQDYTQAVDLAEQPMEEQEIIDRYDNKTRTAIRKSRREGVEVHHDLPLGGETLDVFYDILKRNRERIGVTPTHTRDELEKLASLAPRHLDLSLAYHHGRPIAGILNFICNEHVLLEFYIAHNHEDQAFRPVPLLVHETILRAKRRGFQWLDFGISTEPGGKVTWGLVAFKENFSVKGFFRNTLVLDDLQGWRPSEVFLPERMRVVTDIR